MASIISFLLVLALAFAFPATTFAGGRQGFFLKSEVGPVKLSCHVNGTTMVDLDFRQGENYNDQVKLNKAYSCIAIWVPRYFAPVALFDPARDNCRATTYWKVDEKGWHLSCDDKIYNLESPWQTE